MELTEVVTPSVAIPVLGVLVCAFLVFAFGFKSPGQPPSFEAFDEESKKKRNKRSKGKSQSNGHALTIPDEGNINTSAKPQPSPKQTKQTPKQASSTKGKQASQALEQPKKTKKAAVVKEVAKEQPVTPKQEQQETQDDDGWQTIIKKDKKQKKREERGETPIEEKYIAMEKQPVIMEEPVAIQTEEKQELAPASPQASPQEQRQKKKKDKKAKKGKLELEAQEVVHDTELESRKEEAQEPIIDIEIIPVQTAQPELEIVAENNVEHHIQDAMETHEAQEEEVLVVKKKSKSKKKKQSPAPVPELAPVHPDPVQPTPVQPDPVQPHPVPDKQEPESVAPEAQSSLSPKEENTPLMAKSPKKKQKKERRKGNTESKSGDPEEDVGGASGSVEPSLSHSLTDVSKQTPKITELSQEVVPGPAPGAEAAAAQSPGATFDELGGLSESWTEAKPKSKKKKARREN